MADYEPMPTVCCPGCGKVGRVSRVTQRVTETVRGRDVEVTKVTRTCAGCGAEWEHSWDPDWRVAAYQKLGIPICDQHIVLGGRQIGKTAALAGCDIRPGDHVRHGPSGETWTVGSVRDGYVYPMGYPPSRAPAADCQVITAP